MPDQDRMGSTVDAPSPARTVYLERVCIMSNVKTLTLSAIGSLTEALKHEDKATRIWVKTTDTIIAEGVTSADLAIVKKGGSEALRDQVKTVIVATFTAAEQKLLASDVKTLSDADKVKRRTAQQKIGARFALVELKLRTAEALLKGKVATTATTAIQRIQIKLKEVIEALQKIEGAEFDITEAVKRINAVKGMMPAA